jgi:hypothetical protein
LKDQRHSSPALGFSLPFLARTREGRADPASAVSRATRDQVSRSFSLSLGRVRTALVEQTDPLAPAGRRFANFV